jgi:hypothetical protein
MCLYVCFAPYLLRPTSSTPWLIKHICCSSFIMCLKMPVCASMYYLDTIFGLDSFDKLTLLTRVHSCCCCYQIKEFSHSILLPIHWQRQFYWSLLFVVFILIIIVIFVLLCRLPVYPLLCYRFEGRLFQHGDISIPWAHHCRCGHLS